MLRRELEQLALGIDHDAIALVAQQIRHQRADRFPAARRSEAGQVDEIPDADEVAAQPGPEGGETLAHRPFRGQARRQQASQGLHFARTGRLADPAEDQPPTGQEIASQQIIQPGQPCRAIRAGGLPAPAAEPVRDPQQDDDAEPGVPQPDDHGIE